MTNCQVFISYRREGGDHFAGRLSDRLRKLGYDVFYDIESMKAGKFNEQILEAIDSCQDVLVVLPKNGLDRCVNEDDWVRREIEYAIEKQKKVIPLLLDGFDFPAVLPEKMDDIRHYEGVKAESYYFTAMIERVQELMDSVPDPSKNPEKNHLQTGIRFLQLKLYKKAIETLDKALSNDMSDPEIYFYTATAMLEGKRPFMVSKSAIDEMETYVNTANVYGEKAIYHYLLAYIKYDFYSKKKLHTSPTYEEHLQKANECGVTENEIRELFEFLNVNKPDEF